MFLVNEGGFDEESVYLNELVGVARDLEKRNGGIGFSWCRGLVFEIL